jgi:outer membrane murein-binding lipoprotein Lpp
MTEIYMGDAQRGSEDTSAFNARVTDLEDQNGSATLTTTAQTLSGAVNELDEDIEALETLAGDTELPTTEQTLTGAIDELYTNVAQCAVRSYHTNDALVAADGKVTWEITTAQWQYCVVSVYVTSTGVEVAPVSITHTTDTVTLELEAEEDVEAGYFTATVVG